MKKLTRFGAALGGFALATAGLVAVPTAAMAAPGDVQVDNGGVVTEHATLSDAFAAALAGATITLTGDEVVTNQVLVVDRAITLDLAGYDIDFTAAASATRIEVRAGGDLNIVGPGELRETVLDQYAPVMLRGSANPADTSKVTVGAGVTLTGWAGLFFSNTAGSNNGMIADIHGTLQTNFPTTGTGLYVNGSITEATTTVIPVINVHAGATISGGPIGMYLAGSTTTTITSATVTGTSVGVEVRAGYVTLNDATLTGGSGTPAANPAGSGSSSTNSALAIVQHTTAQPLEVTVNGGTFTGGAAVQVANPETTNPAMTGVDVSITSGTFNGPVVSSNAQTGNDPLAGFVSGGVFSDGIDPDLVSDDVAILVSAGGVESRVLSPAAARSGAAASAQVDGHTVYFASAADAREAADEGTEITLITLAATGIELDALVLGGVLLAAGGAVFMLRRRVATTRA